MTVRGPIEDEALGFTLPHEHILVDFGGAQTASPERYDADEVVQTMLPHLRQAAEAGVRGFVDCTPAYLARDVGVLKRLAERTGLNIITNTGQYKEPFLPERTLELSARDQEHRATGLTGEPPGARELADGWIGEWRDGIEGTDVRPGFIKTAVFATALAAPQRTVITAAALTSRETGLPIGTHTESGVAALHVIRTLEAVGVDPERWIYIHAHMEADHDLVLMAAREGVWIELDGIGGASDQSILALLLKLLDAGFSERILLSHDRGWYSAGEPGGGEVKPYTYLTERFLPLLQSFGVDQELRDQLTVTNPARAFRVRGR